LHTGTLQCATQKLDVVDLLIFSEHFSGSGISFGGLQDTS